MPQDEIDNFYSANPLEVSRYRMPVFATSGTVTYSDGMVIGRGAELESIFIEDDEPKDPDKLFVQEIKKRLDAGEILPKEDYRKFMRILKKKGHIDRSYRQQLHHIKDEEGKSMEAVSVDDLVPS